jgi:hypothetical protein
MVETGRYAEADARLTEGYNIIVGDRGPENPRSRTAAVRLVDLHQRWGRPQRAEELRE